VSVQALLEMARVYLALSDSAGAREVLRQARDILRRCGDLGVLANQIDELTSKLDTMRTVRVGASSLTAAELRLVPFLSTYLTFPQIAERLFVSRNTIKSQAISIYQKLGVSSRGEAIEQLQEIGLLEG
jgi:LuxR family maltose regulon positive regulatory protein